MKSPAPRVRLTVFLAALIAFSSAGAQSILIPMDLEQTDHLKAYGVAYWVLEQGVNVEWLLNYRGGGFLVPATSALEHLCRLRGVAYQTIGAGDVAAIYSDIETANMERVMLEKAPKVAVYVPPNFQPWDDAVTLALEYASANIRVNAICPGIVDTDMGGELIEYIAGIEGVSLEEARRSLASEVPLQRHGMPEEIAEVVAFLASSKASYITGAAIPVGGGLVAGL